MVFVAIGPAEAQFVQNRGRERRQNLGAQHVRAVPEIRSRVQGILAAHRGVERVLVAEIVVAHEDLVFAADYPIRPEVQKLGVLHAGATAVRLAGSPMAAASEAEMVLGWGSPRFRCFVAAENKQLVLDDGAAALPA